MSRRDRLSDFAAQMGFSVTVSENEVVAENVPCLLEGGNASSCTITQSFDPATGKPDDRIGTAAHAVRITIAEERDGRVYHADGSAIGTHLTGDGRTWSDISVRGGTQSQPEDDASPHDTVHRYAKRIVGAWAAAGHAGAASPTRANPFKIPNTFEERAAIAPDPGSDSRPANRDHRPGRYGCVRSGPLGEDTRTGNPPLGLRPLRLAHLHASTRRAYRGGDQAGQDEEGLGQGGLLRGEIRRPPRGHPKRTPSVWRVPRRWLSFYPRIQLITPSCVSTSCTTAIHLARMSCTKLSRMRASRS